MSGSLFSGCIAPTALSGPLDRFDGSGFSDAGFCWSIGAAAAEPLFRSRKPLHINGKTTSPEAVTPIGKHPPGGGSSALEGPAEFATVSEAVGCPAKTPSQGASRSMATRCANALRKRNDCLPKPYRDKCNV
jgi:hypothetical protein